MKKKKIAKIITFFVLSIALVTAHIKCVNDLYDDYVDKVYNMGYTKYNLTLKDLWALFYFDISVPEILDNRIPHRLTETNQYNKDKKTFELVCGENTEDRIKIFNEILIEEGTTLAEKYGFSESNPITSEWILTHPKEIKILIYSKRYRSVQDEFVKELGPWVKAYLGVKIMYYF